MTTKLVPEPLTAVAFGPFGEVIETSDAAAFDINQGTTRRFDDLARIDVSAQNGQPGLSIFRAAARSFPFEVVELERHPLGSQAFVPLAGQDFVVVVAPAGEDVTRSDLRAFVATGGQGINLAPGVWHHALIATADNSEFVVIDRIGPGDNCDVIAVDAMLTAPPEVMTRPDVA